MPVFKNEDNGTWYVMARYVKLERGTQAEMQAWLCYQTRSTGMGKNVQIADFFRP